MLTDQRLEQLGDAMKRAIYAYRDKADDHLFNHDDSIQFYLDEEDYYQFKRFGLMSAMEPKEPFRFMGIRVISGRWEYGLTPNVITLSGGTTYAGNYATIKSAHKT